MSNIEKKTSIFKPRSKFKTLGKFFVKRLKEGFVQLDIKMALKVTIAALLSLYACLTIENYVKHPDYLAPGLWCVVTTIVVLQTNIGGLYQAIWIRFIGVLLGSVVGALVAFLFGAEVMALGFAFFITIVLCSLLRIPDSYRMASLSVAIIMIPWKMHPTEDPWVDAFFRFLDTCLGLIVAIFVSHLLWPSQALTKMRLSMAEIFTLFHQFFEHILIPADSLHKSPKISQFLFKEIDQAFLDTRKDFEESKTELFMRLAPIRIWLDLMNCQSHLWESLRALQDVFSSTVEEVFDQPLRQQVQHAVEVIDFALKELSIKLKKGQTSFDFNILDDLQDSLNREMIRFRSTHTTKRYSLDVVEIYFVFFYQLKQMVIALYHFNQTFDRLEHLNESRD